MRRIYTAVKEETLPRDGGYCLELKTACQQLFLSNYRSYDAHAMLPVYNEPITSNDLANNEG